MQQGIEDRRFCYERVHSGEEEHACEKDQRIDDLLRFMTSFLCYGFQLLLFSLELCHKVHFHPYGRNITSLWPIWILGFSIVTIVYVAQQVNLCYMRELELVLQV